jgi:hypothetical protein
MPYTWYVTFEVQKRGMLPRRRSPRATRNFETETEAKDFARAKHNGGLIVFAGTINPYSPKQLIPSKTCLAAKVRAAETPSACQVASF